LIDSRARDGNALPSVLAGREGRSEPVTRAMHLLAQPARPRQRITADFTLLAAATNLAGLATRGISSHTTG
jgi:hypothetical protein